MGGWMNGQRKIWDIHTIEYYSALKRRKSAICNDMSELGGTCAKWNKLDTEGQVLHVFTYMCALK